MTTRSRAPNFTKEEQVLLLKVCEKYHQIIENKNSDSVTNALKLETWGKITEIYNSNITVPRTSENLLGCYRNLKTKMKKQYADAKMNLNDPNQKEALVSALEEGKDWKTISLDLNQPIKACKTGFELMKKEVVKKENCHKKLVLGGGPPPSDDDDDAIISRIKKIIEPQLDGLYTTYNGDSMLMKEFPESVPEKDRIEPIETSVGINFVQNIHPMDIGAQKKINSKTNQTDGATSAKKPKKVTDSFTDLVERKLELVQLQKITFELDIAHKRQMYALELEDAIKQNKHKKLIREKELLLLDLQIKKLSE